MKVERSHDAVFLNRVLAHPSVHPWVCLGKDMAFDMSAVVADDNNVFLANEYGGFLFVKMGDGLYDVHTQFLPQGRGVQVLNAANDAAQYMFTQTDCIGIRTFVADGNDRAKKLTKAMGFDDAGSGEVLGVTGLYFVLTLKRWIKRFLCQQQQ